MENQPVYDSRLVDSIVVFFRSHDLSVCVLPTIVMCLDQILGLGSWVGVGNEKSTSFQHRGWHFIPHHKIASKPFA